MAEATNNRTASPAMKWLDSDRMTKSRMQELGYRLAALLTLLLHIVSHKAFLLKKRQTAYATPLRLVAN